MVNKKKKEKKREARLELNIIHSVYISVIMYLCWYAQVVKLVEEMKTTIKICRINYIIQQRAFLLGKISNIKIWKSYKEREIRVLHICIYIYTLRKDPWQHACMCICKREMIYIESVLTHTGSCQRSRSFRTCQTWLKEK